MVNAPPSSETAAQSESVTTLNTKLLSDDIYAKFLFSHINYLDQQAKQEVINSYHFAFKAHEGQYRRSGEPYISHPVSVSIILADMHMDAQSLMAALLHDVIEDCNIDKEVISQQFGPTVAEIVDGVSKISALQIAPKAVRQAENFRKMMLAMTKDIRVILVKLADRLHNMRTLNVLNPEKRRRIAKETLEIYAPIANRLGMNNLRIEFEDLGFATLYPMRSELINKAVKKARGNRNQIMHALEESLTKKLHQANLTGKVIGREKHIYSIYQKMKKQRKYFSQIMDVYGFRIITQTIDECYRILGAVHNLFKPIPGRFKDYIAIPKANGYQSLHTTLKGISGVPIEIQIRTEQMEAMANSGIAAHWLYKSNECFNQGTQSRTQAWVKGLLELQENAGNSLEFVESVKIDLFPDEVYTFTPKGNILELPQGATPIDFAYAVHTDIGNRCIAARIDQQLTPLSTKLQSGQTVEIITAPHTRPNPNWLNFAVTGKARTNIKHFLKNQRRTESIALGKQLLEKALASLNLSLEDVSNHHLERVVKESNFASSDDLFEAIGLGNRMAPLVARCLLPRPKTNLEQPATTPLPLTIQGTEGMVIHFAKCCYPIPGDPIVAFLSAGRGMVVHRDNCPNITTELKQTPEKCLAVTWDQNIKTEFSASLYIALENKPGVLAELATIIAECNSNIETILMGDKDIRLSTLHLTFSVIDRIHLARIIKRVRTCSKVIRISRNKK